MERFVGGVKNAKGEEHCCEGLENCSSVGKSPTCSSQIFTSISLRLELNLEWYSDRSLYPSVSTTSPCRMWSVERISTARNKLHSAASFFEFLSTVAYEYIEFEYTIGIPSRYYMRTNKINKAHVTELWQFRVRILIWIEQLSFWWQKLHRCAKIMTAELLMWVHDIFHCSSCH